MLSYVNLGTHDLQRAARFYDAALAPLGYVRLASVPREIGYGPKGGQARLWVLLPFDDRAGVGVRLPCEPVISVHGLAEEAEEEAGVRAEEEVEDRAFLFDGGVQECLVEWDAGGGGVNGSLQRDEVGHRPSEQVTAPLR